MSRTSSTASPPLTSAPNGVMMPARRQPDSLATALNKFCSIRTANGVYTEFGIAPFENIGVSLQCGEGHSIPVAQVWLIQPVRWLISSDAVAQKLRAGRSPHPIFASSHILLLLFVPIIPIYTYCAYIYIHITIMRYQDAR